MLQRDFSSLGIASVARSTRCLIFVFGVIAIAAAVEEFNAEKSRAKTERASDFVATHLNPGGTIRSGRTIPG